MGFSLGKQAKHNRMIGSSISSLCVLLALGSVLVRCDQAQYGSQGGFGGARGFGGSSGGFGGSGFGGGNGDIAEAVPGIPGADYPIFAEVPQSPFFCGGRVEGGYYADPEADCQAFHICAADSEGGLTKYSFLCPNGTLFNQQYFICDWWFNVDCSLAQDLYSRNGEVAAERQQYTGASSAAGGGNAARGQNSGRQGSQQAATGSRATASTGFANGAASRGSSRRVSSSSARGASSSNRASVSSANRGASASAGRRQSAGAAGGRRRTGAQTAYSAPAGQGSAGFSTNNQGGFSGSRSSFAANQAVGASSNQGGFSGSQGGFSSSQGGFASQAADGYGSPVGDFAGASFGNLENYARNSRDINIELVEDSIDQVADEDDDIITEQL